MSSRITDTDMTQIPYFSKKDYIIMLLSWTSVSN